MSAASAVPTSTPPASTPDTGSTFESLNIPAKVVAVLARQEITIPTPVQSAVIPDAMEGHDLLGRARTGSGKTLAFGLPILARLAGDRSRPKHPRALIVVPTRELATQVRRSLEPLAEALRLKLTTVYGGTPYDRQIKQLRNGADIVVATPGRLEDLINRGACRLEDIQITVLDEADHLCDLGFYPVVDQLMRETPAGSQRLLLSATLDGDVDKLVRTHLRTPKVHKLDSAEGSVTTMDHHVMVVGGFRDKVTAATALVEANPRSIVFTRTREGATELAESLTEGGIEAVDLHGNLSQRVRERNLHKFSSGKAQVVVATDVAARGIHVDHVGLVIHYDAPADAKAYLHRSGRTARAGASGAVITITTPRQLDEIVRLQKRAGVEVRHHDIRSAPRPLTAEALAESGEAAPSPRTGGGSRGGYQGNRGSGSTAGYQGNRGSGSTGGYQGNREDRGSSFGAQRPSRDYRAGSFGGERRTEARPPRDDRSYGDARPTRDARPERTQRTERSERTERTERTDFRDRGFRPDRGDRPQRTERPDNRTSDASRERPGSTRPATTGSAPPGAKKPRWSQAGR